MHKRIGLMLATIHQGSGIALWRAVSKEAKKRDDTTLFVFPGGRLNYLKDNEYLRNEVFSLVNSTNIDSSIIWASSLTGKVDYNQVGEYIRKINEDLPVVAMGMSIAGIPSVDFNAYSGFFNEVDHLIRVHGCKKIAMVRGPESHPSAEARFEAYKSALKENGIAYDANLVATPCAWAEGNKAIRELIEDRHLTPGVDFDAVCFASDLLMFWASKYLDSIGVQIPTELKIVGFNDSEENSMMSVDSTTVRMPIKTLANTSYTLVCDVCSNREDSPVNIVLPTEVILRHSCGCENVFGGEESAKDVFSSWDSLTRWLRESLDESVAVDALVDLLHLIYIDSISVDASFKQKAIPYLERYFNNGGNTKLLCDCIILAERYLSDKKLTNTDRDCLYELIGYQHSRSNVQKEFKQSILISTLNRFKLELLTMSSDLDLTKCMQKNLPQLGIDKAFICTHLDDDRTLLRCGFSSNNLLKGGESFNREQMLPKEYLSELEGGIFVVLPLVYDTSNVGYLILSTTLTEGKILEDIRTSISSVLKTISLFDIAREKSKKAEEEEKRSADFYAKLSEGLSEPLEEIKKLSEGTSFDRDALLACVTQAEHLLKLSLAEKGEMEMQRQFVPFSPISDMLSSLGYDIERAENLPSIDIDSEKIKEVFSIIKDEIISSSDSPEVKISLDSTTLSFVISGKKKAWKPALKDKDNSMLFAERVVLMHGGSFSFSSRAVKISLPFLSLSNQVQKSATTVGSVLFIADENDNIPDSLKALNPVVISQEKLLQAFKLPQNTVSIALDASSEHKPSTILINLLRNHVDSKALPILLFGVDSPSISVATALEGSLPKNEKATIFSFGQFPSSLGKLREFGTVVEVQSIEDAESVEGNGALAIFYKFDQDLFNSFREKEKFNHTPILIVSDHFKLEQAEALQEMPNVLMSNTSITESEEFVSRIVGIFGGSELLPALTSVLVKKAIAYINKNASQPISRWQLAEAVNISEDYLTRIFRKEVGISPWDYLNRYRIQLACKLLTQTGLSINEIAQDTGFQDQAYFCRVFKKVKGFPPGHIRQRV